MEAFADIKKTLAEGFKVENKGEWISHALLKILQNDEELWKHFTKLKWDSKRALFELVKAVGDNPDSKLDGRARTDYMIWEEKFNLVSNVWMEDTLYVSEDVTEEILAKYFAEEKATITRDTQAEIATVVPKSEIKEVVSFDLDNIDMENLPTGENLKRLMDQILEKAGTTLDTAISDYVFPKNKWEVEFLNKQWKWVQILQGALAEAPINWDDRLTREIFVKYLLEGWYISQK